MMRQMPTCMLLLTLLLAPVWAWAGDDDEDGRKKAHYHALGPNFTVNLRNPEESQFGGFLRTRVEVMVRGNKDLDTVKLHTPYLRNDLIMLFTSKTREQLLRPGGQKHLRRQALNVLRKRIRKENRDTQIVKVLFTQVIIE